jgi:hypothetical protein
MMSQQATTAAVVVSLPRTLLLLVQLGSQGVAMTWRSPTRLLVVSSRPLSLVFVLVVLHLGLL